MKGDLHCHTRLSDGSMGIEDIVLLAKKAHVEAIAVTDHDCMAGTVRAQVIGQRHGVEVIPGVEISCRDPKRGGKAHLLAYFVEAPDRLEGLCKNITTARRRAGQLMALKTATKYPILTEQIVKCAAGSTNLYKQHIMYALMEAGYTNSIYGELYDELFSPSNPNNILVAFEYPDIFEVVDAVHGAGGVAVLAHPYMYGNVDLIEELAEKGLDGIEVWHPTCNEEKITILMGIARKNGLLMTGGSDFHGLYNKSTVRLGEYNTPDEHMNEFMSYKSKKQKQQKKAARVAD